jgi:hypothetical protein
MGDYVKATELNPQTIKNSQRTVASISEAPVPGTQFVTLDHNQLEEARFQEIVHKNPSIATLKALARNNKYHSARFVIYNDGDLVAGDSEHFTHQDIAPAMGAWAIRGYVQYMGDNDYAYRSMEVYSPQNKDHPMFRIWERSGIVNGNPAVVEETWSAKYKRSIDCHHPRGFSQRAHCAARRKRQAGGKTASKSVHENNLDQLVHNILENLSTQGLTEAQAVEQVDQQLTEDLRKWFREKWVRFGPDGKIRGACARGSEGEGKPKCLPQKKAWALGKKQRATAALRKRREDPNPEREGKARNVATRESIAEVAKVRISLDPKDLGAYVYDEDPPEPTTLIPLGEITYVLEPDHEHATKPGFQARIARMVKTLEKGKQLPPVLVRKYQGSYQILDGHHRFKAYRMVNAKEIPARIVAPENITGDIAEQSQDTCPHCGGPVYDRMLAEKHDACYYKVKSRYKVWPSAYASGALVQCRKQGAKNWGKDS